MRLSGTSYIVSILVCLLLVGVALSASVGTAKFFVSNNPNNTIPLANPYELLLEQLSDPTVTNPTAGVTLFTSPSPAEMAQISVVFVVFRDTDRPHHLEADHMSTILTNNSGIINITPTVPDRPFPDIRELGPGDFDFRPANNVYYSQVTPEPFDNRPAKIIFSHNIPHTPILDPSVQPLEAQNFSRTDQNQEWGPGRMFFNFTSFNLQKSESLPPINLVAQVFRGVTSAAYVIRFGTSAPPANFGAVSDVALVQSQGTSTIVVDGATFLLEKGDSLVILGGRNFTAVSLDTVNSVVAFAAPEGILSHDPIPPPVDPPSTLPPEPQAEPNAPVSEPIPIGGSVGTAKFYVSDDVAAFDLSTIYQHSAELLEDDDVLYEEGLFQSSSNGTKISVILRVLKETTQPRHHSGDELTAVISENTALISVFNTAGVGSEPDTHSLGCGDFDFISSNTVYYIQHSSETYEPRPAQIVFSHTVPYASTPDTGDDLEEIPFVGTPSPVWSAGKIWHENTNLEIHTSAYPPVGIVAQAFLGTTSKVSLLRLGDATIEPQIFTATEDVGILQSVGSSTIFVDDQREFNLASGDSILILSGSTFYGTSPDMENNLMVVFTTPTGITTDLSPTDQPSEEPSGASSKIPDILSMIVVVSLMLVFLAIN